MVTTLPLRPRPSPSNITINPHPYPPPLHLVSNNHFSSASQKSSVVLSNSQANDYRESSLPPDTPPPTPGFPCNGNAHVVEETESLHHHVHPNNYIGGWFGLEPRQTSPIYARRRTPSMERYLEGNDSENLLALIELSPRQHPEIGELLDQLERLGLMDAPLSPPLETPTISSGQPDGAAPPPANTTTPMDHTRKEMLQSVNNTTQFCRHDPQTWLEHPLVNGQGGCTTHVSAHTWGVGSVGVKDEKIKDVCLRTDEIPLSQSVIAQLLQDTHLSRPHTAPAGDDQRTCGSSSRARPTQSTPSPVLSTSRKRLLEVDGSEKSGDPSEEVNGNGKRLATQRDRALYACPYYRSNPDNDMFSPCGTHEKCKSQGIKRDKLKEHIRRKHTKPHQCPICGRRGDKGEIKEHRRTVQCRSNSEIIKVDEETLKKDELLGNNRKLRWHQVFKILFPDQDDLPEASQWFDGGRTDYHQLVDEALVAYLECNLPTILQGFYQSPQYLQVGPHQNSAATGTDQSGFIIQPVRVAEIISRSRASSQSSIAQESVLCESFTSSSQSPQDTISRSFESHPQSLAPDETLPTTPTPLMLHPQSPVIQATISQSFTPDYQGAGTPGIISQSVTTHLQRQEALTTFNHTAPPARGLGFSITNIPSLNSVLDFSSSEDSANFIVPGETLNLLWDSDESLHNSTTPAQDIDFAALVNEAFHSAASFIGPEALGNPIHSQNPQSTTTAQANVASFPANRPRIRRTQQFYWDEWQ